MTIVVARGHDRVLVPEDLVGKRIYVDLLDLLLGRHLTIEEAIVNVDDTVTNLTINIDPRIEKEAIVVVEVATK